MYIFKGFRDYFLGENTFLFAVIPGMITLIASTLIMIITIKT